MMAWLLRTVVCAVCVAGGVLGWFTYRHTNSEAVRRTLIEQMEAQFQGVDVEIGAAWLRPFGGICVRDLTLKRRDDPTHPFLVVPGATIFHDKEQLSRGRLAIRKIELDQPSYLLRRDLEGNWNLSGITRSVAGTGDGPIPIIVLHQGTIRYEDRSGGITRPILELHDVNATAINDPATRVSFQGSANSILGPIKWSGNWQRDRNEAQASLELTDFAVTPALIRDLARHVPQLTEHLGEFEAKGNAKLNLQYQAGSPTPWKPELTVNLRHGRLRHPKLPVPLNDLALTVKYSDNQITVDPCKCRSGDTEMSVVLKATLPPAATNVEDPESCLNFLRISVQHFTVTPELFNYLPPNLNEVHTNFQPKGPLSLTYRFERGERSWSRLCTLFPEGMEARHAMFPYPMRDIRGTLEQLSDSAGTERLTIHMTGTASGRAIKMEGLTEGAGPTFKMDLKIDGRDVPINEDLLGALGPHRPAVEAFKPTGAGDFTVAFTNRPGNPETEIKASIFFHNLSICADVFPYPLEEMTGLMKLTFGQRGRLEFQKFHGRHHGGEVDLNGSVDLRPAGNELNLTVTASSVPFDGDLARAVAHIKLQSAWQTISPHGRLSFSARMKHIDHAAPLNAPKPPGELEIVFDRMHGDVIVPDFLPYELTDVSLSFRYAKNEIVLTDFQGMHDTSCIRIGFGKIRTKSNGGLYCELTKIVVDPLVPNDELRVALPLAMRSTMVALEPSGTMSLTAGYVVVDTLPSPPETSQVVTTSLRRDSRRVAAESVSPWIYWENVIVRFNGASLKLGVRFETIFGELGCRGEYRDGHLGAVDGNLIMDRASLFRQPIQNIHTHLVIDPVRAPNVLQVLNIKGNLYGGTVSGEGSVTFGSTLEYEIKLNGMQFQLEEIARINRLGPNTQLSGKATVQLHLKGQGGDIANMSGDGSIDVPKGRLYDLPPLLDLLKFLKLRTPDGTAFEEAHARFAIQGRRVHFNEIELLGGLVNLTGNGDMNLDGTNVKLDVYPLWSRMAQVLPATMHDISAGISRGMYKIEMRGAIGEPLETRGEFVPFLAEPVRRFLAPR